MKHLMPGCRCPLCGNAVTNRNEEVACINENCHFSLCATTSGSNKALYNVRLFKNPRRVNWDSMIKLFKAFKVREHYPQRREV
jgi:hypothetical protein